jgi:hypothetical protein
MKAKIDFSTAKMVARDEDYATFKNKQGHEFKIAVKALHPENRKNLDSIELHTEDKDEAPKKQKLVDAMARKQMLADGGVAKGKKPVDRGPYIDPKAAKEMEKGATAPGWQPETWKKNLKEGLGIKSYAQGGHVLDPYQTMPMEQEKKDSGEGATGLLGKMFMAEGGKVDYEPIQKEHYEERPKKKKKIDHVDYEPFEHVEYEPIEKEHVDYEPIARYAEGTPDMPVSPMDEAMPGQMSPMQEQMAAAPEAPGQIDPQALQMASALQAQSSMQQPQDPSAGLMAAASSVPLPQGATSVEQVVPSPSTLDGYAAQQASHFGMGQEQALAAQKEANKLAGYSQFLHDHEAAVRQKAEDHAKELASFAKDVADTHIDPNRYMAKQDTNDRVRTMFSLFLGGFGDGPNPAMQFLNSQIDRDIDAQKAELGKKQTLYSAMLERHKDERTAMDMTKALMTTANAVDLQQIAAKAQAPMAKLRAQQMQGALQMQVGQLVDKSAQAQAFGDLEQKAKQNPQLYPQVIDRLAASDPKRAQDLRERLVPGVGLANTPKDANEVKDISIAATGAKSAIDELKAIMGTPGKSLSPNERARAGSIRQQLIGQMRVAILGPGTVNESERALLENLIPDPTSILSLDSSNLIKLNALEKRMAEGVQQQLQARGVAGSMPNMQAAQAPQEQIKIVNGKKYRRGPNGEAIEVR